MGLLAKGLLLCYAWLFYWCTFTVELSLADIFTYPPKAKQKKESTIEVQEQISPQKEVDNLIKDARREIQRREIQDKKILYVFVGDCLYSKGAIETAGEFLKRYPDYEVKIFSTIFDGKRLMELKKQWSDDVVIHVPGDEIEKFKIEKIPAFVFIRDGKFHKVYGQPSLEKYFSSMQK